MKTTKEEISSGAEFLELFQGVNQSQSPRIASALSNSIAARRQPDLFEGLQDEDRANIMVSDEAYYIDRRDKAMSLTREDIQLVTALSSCIDFDDPDVIENARLLGTINKEGKTHGYTPVEISVNVMQLSRVILGDANEAHLRKIEERLKRLAGIKQVQHFKIGKESYTVVRPLIFLNEQIYKNYSEVRDNRGKVKNNSDKENKILIGARVVLSGLFIYEAMNKYCRIDAEKLFKVWRGNKTELFAVLLSDLEGKWNQYYTNAISAEKRAAEEHKSLKAAQPSKYYELIAEVKRKAFIYKSSTLTIRNRVVTDYETSRAQRARFISDLQKAINSLVEYGIITDKSHITKDRANVIFMYNPEFATKLQEV